MDCFVIIDMIKGFFEKGNLADPSMKSIIPKVVSGTQNAISNGSLIVCFKDVHEVNDEEFKQYPPHCIKGTEECELIDELKAYENEMLIIEKNTTNGFNTNTFKDILNGICFNNVYVAGCCTDICVKNFVLSYLNHNKMNFRKTNIHVLTNAVATFNSENHLASRENRNALLEMQSKGAILGNSKMFLEDLTK